MNSQKKSVGKIIRGIIITFCSLLVMYLGISLYFVNRLSFGSVINNVSLTGKTVNEADKQMESSIKSYELALIERGGTKEIIKAEDIGLKNNSKSKIQQIKDQQNAFGWIYSFINNDKTSIKGVVSFDQKMFDSYISKLSCLKNDKLIEPKNPTFEYENNKYSIVKEIDGNRVQRDLLVKAIVRAISNGETAINLDKLGCYDKAKYTSASKEVVSTENLINKYVSSKITYDFGDKKEVVDGSVISGWIDIDDDYSVSIDQEKVKQYVRTLASKYNTVGKTRKFHTTYGTDVNVTGGTYGCSIDRTKEIDSLISTIKEGEKVERKPIYSQTSKVTGENDIGNTYVEISLSNQHLWFYKDGNLIVQGDVVTGNVYNGTSTPSGTYYVIYKEKNATLKGEGYECPVSFWMPFNGGIGIHDASWRSEFGGSIYLSSGSHGCVNSPYSLASTIYSNIEAGTPVICY